MTERITRNSRHESHSPMNTGPVRLDLEETGDTQAHKTASAEGVSERWRRVAPALQLFETGWSGYSGSLDRDLPPALHYHWDRENDD
jgi:hypothetical protein